MINIKSFTWNKDSYSSFLKELDSYKEGESFLKFTKKIVFTKYEILGIKVPNLRKIAKKISKTNIESFLKQVTNSSYEEIMIEGLVISYIEDYQIFLNYFESFIKKIDNWSICDVCISSMKIVNKNKDDMLNNIKKYLASNDEFIMRVGIILLLDFYQDNVEEVLSIIDYIDTTYYYVQIAIAWLISVLFIKYRVRIIKYLKNDNLDVFTHNKAIQKIIESTRVSKDDKNMIRKLKKLDVS